MSPLPAPPPSEPQCAEFGEPIDSYVASLLQRATSAEAQAKIAEIIWEFSPIGRGVRREALTAAVMERLRGVARSLGL